MLRSLYTGKLLHWRLGLIRTEYGFASHPFGAFSRYSPLCELVAKLDLKLGAVKTTLSVCLGNEEFSMFFSKFIRGFVEHKGGCGEDELKRFNLCEFRLEGLICINRKTRSSYFQLAS